jgi:hypothetical protein
METDQLGIQVQSNFRVMKATLEDQLLVKEGVVVKVQQQLDEHSQTIKQFNRNALRAKWKVSLEANITPNIEPNIPWLIYFLSTCSICYTNTICGVCVVMPWMTMTYSATEFVL